MKKRNHKIKPFKGYRANLVIKSVASIAPRIAALSKFKTGIRYGIKKLTNNVLGIVDYEDMETAAGGIMILQQEAEYALHAAVTIIAYVCAPIQNLAEYNTFSSITLPEKGAKPKRMLWTQNVNEASMRHFKAVAVLRDMCKSAPKYRETGHDYAEDMLVMSTKVLMRPAIVTFSRYLEENLGWTSVENSGVLSHVSIAPKFEITSEAVQ
jgi:hypothetical protein